MVRDQTLVRDVVFVDADVRLAHVERNVALSGRQSAKVGDHDFDDEEADPFEMPCDVLEARDLRVLRRQVHDRVENEIGEPERPVDASRCEVADRDADLLRTRLPA